MASSLPPRGQSPCCCGQFLPSGLMEMLGRRLTCEVGVDCGSSTSERVPQWAPPLNRPREPAPARPRTQGNGMPEKPGCVEFPGDSTPIHPVPRTIVQFIAGRMTTCQVRAQRLVESFKHSRQTSECCVSFDSLVSSLGHRDNTTSTLDRRFARCHTTGQPLGNVERVETLQSAGVSLSTLKVRHPPNWLCLLPC